MNMVENTYKERFNKGVHPLIYLWMIEALINVGANKKDLEPLLNDIVNSYPDFIPFQVYSWQLEKDKKVKESKYKNLKNKYPKHWIVKQI